MPKSNLIFNLLYVFAYAKFLSLLFLLSAACDRQSADTGLEEDIPLYTARYRVSWSNAAFLVIS